ncbi:hypothetical protein C0Q60_13530 [Streptomyces albidoflavus]|nr:hypothetical protein C0Q60_13530 [Streptomyces albidoflavus]RZD98260.1 hypothetical protein C0Q62_13415 [Streptomyces albidoflavus]
MEQNPKPFIWTKIEDDIFDTFATSSCGLRFGVLASGSEFVRTHIVDAVLGIFTDGQELLSVLIFIDRRLAGLS